jgi:hypothetical protein
MATTTPNFGWAVPTSTDLVKDGAVAIETLGDAIDASLVDLKGGTSGQVLKKNSNTDMDFVWSADSAGMTNPMTTTGDTIYSSSGSTPARLGIGSTGQVLTVAGGVPSWATPSGGASGLTYITKQTAADVASLTFDSVFSATYPNYILVYDSVRSTTPATTADLYFQYRYAGPTTQTATYTYALSGANSSSADISVGAGNQSQMIIGRNLGNSGYRLGGQMFLTGVGKGSAEYPIITGQTFDGWGEEIINYGVFQSTQRAYTGFTITTSSGNINGTFTLYGLANS